MMDCEQNAYPSDTEYIKAFSRNAVRNRVPLYGSLNLTQHCNLRCVHCYCTREDESATPAHREYDTPQWIGLVNEITEAGCLFLLITGGEPLLRKDFHCIYRHAREKGLLVAVFTNGTLISQDVLDLFRELPPRAVEVTLYGATPSTYEKITGVKGSFESCMRGIHLLKDNSINVKLKTVLMKLNRHEMGDMKSLAEKLDVSFRFDAAIFPRFSGDRAPLALRVPPEELIRHESSPDQTRKLASFYEKYRDAPETNNMYKCGAGLSSFHVDSYGNLQPCLMTSRYRYSLLKKSFREGWHTSVQRIRSVKAEESHRCNSCHKRVLCGYCPPFFELENNAEDSPSAYLCATGDLRFRLISGKIDCGEENEKERRVTRSFAGI